ncbi:protein phosphatase 1D-like [Petromyzon marinus]|uniref:protein phosphatase 1D-like n=1 Tax=Petromyzon marinus TaxID=7757 RepID=UPI003F6F80D9
MARTTPWAFVRHVSTEGDGDAIFLAVFDGHGGPQAARFARRCLWPSIRAQPGLWGAADPAGVCHAIRDGFLACQRAMWEELGGSWPRTRQGHPSTTGTTACCCLIRGGDELYVAHEVDKVVEVGEVVEEVDKVVDEEVDEVEEEVVDEVVPLLAVALTRDHKPEDPVERERIERLGGRVMRKPGGPCRVAWRRPLVAHCGPGQQSSATEDIPFLAVSRSLGDLWSYDFASAQFVVSPEPDVSAYRLDPGHHRYLVLATDGVWDVLTPTEAVALCHRADAQQQQRARARLHTHTHLHTHKRLHTETIPYLIGVGR